MKHSSIHKYSILLLILIVFTACLKKEKTPKLLVLVKDKSEIPIAGAYVHAWPTENTIPDPTSSGVPNEDMDRESLTNASGEAVLGFPHSAVLNVDVEYTRIITPDSSIKMDGHKVVKITVERLKGDEENIFNETIYID